MKKKDEKISKIHTKKPSKKVEQRKKQSKPEPPRTEPRVFFEYSNEAILLRCQSTSYMDTVKKFSKEQVDEVKNMSFRAILDMNINHISTRLAYWLARNFEEMFDTLNVGKHQIKIISDTVFEVFGIPKGPKPVEIIVDKRKVKKVEKIEKSKEPKIGNSVMDTFINQLGGGGG
ncbi:hypothetical protein HanRHA438_Chr09g0421361 [Helianthus annuus]|nr:hypothetical protein HanRHA438_Chr09g0421361 [Helianthus annuus]